MPDYMYMLESRLSPEQRAVLLRMQELAIESSANLYLTGAAVRDLISGMPIRDLDFTVEGNPSRMVRDWVAGGARIVEEDEKLRHTDLLFAGMVEGSLSAARDDVYARPGAHPEPRWSTIMEDLHRRDFSLNAIAISLNRASRGLLLDPTNGLSDLEKREVRALSIHSFTNQPARLMRALRYAARMDYKLESRTEDWFALALERKLNEAISAEDVGRELRQLGREDRPAAILKLWESRGFLGGIHPQLLKRHPDYEMLGRMFRARDDVASSGTHVRLVAPVAFAALGKLKDRERSATLHRLGFRADEIAAVAAVESEVQKTAKILTGPKTATPQDAFKFLDTAPPDQIVMVLAESSSAPAIQKIRNYLNKWKPLQQALPGVMLELESIGMPRGPEFDKVIQEFFHAQLSGKARVPEDHIKLLRKLSGLKEPTKKEEVEKKKRAEKITKSAGEKKAGPAGSIKPGAPAAVAAAKAGTAPKGKSSAGTAKAGKPGALPVKAGSAPAKAVPASSKGGKAASIAKKGGAAGEKKPAARAKS